MRGKARALATTKKNCTPLVPPERVHRLQVRRFPGGIETGTRGPPRSPSRDRSKSILERQRGGPPGEARDREEPATPGPAQHPAGGREHRCLDHELHRDVPARRADRAAMPISRVRSVTVASMMFMIPMPPTSRLMAAIAPVTTLKMRWCSPSGAGSRAARSRRRRRCRKVRRTTAFTTSAERLTFAGVVHAQHDLVDAVGAGIGAAVEGPSGERRPRGSRRGSGWGRPRPRSAAPRPSATPTTSYQLPPTSTRCPRGSESGKRSEATEAPRTATRLRSLDVEAGEEAAGADAQARRARVVGGRAHHPGVGGPAGSLHGRRRLAHRRHRDHVRAHRAHRGRVLDAQRRGRSWISAIGPDLALSG